MKAIAILILLTTLCVIGAAKFIEVCVNDNAAIIQHVLETR